MHFCSLWQRSYLGWPRKRYTKPAVLVRFRVATTLRCFGKSMATIHNCILLSRRDCREWHIPRGHTVSRVSQVRVLEEDNQATSQNRTADCTSVVAHQSDHHPRVKRFYQLISRAQIKPSAPKSKIHAATDDSAPEIAMGPSEVNTVVQTCQTAS